jgi:ATP-binding cassette subfamily F protein 3
MKRLDRLDRIEDTELQRPDMRINFSIDKVPGRVLSTLKNVSKSFGEVKIIEDANAEITRGDKIGLIGANGKGKSTLLRIVAGTETYEGIRIEGHNVKDAFYAQHQLEALNLEATVLEELHASRSGKTDLEIRSLLGCFLFSGDDVSKKIKVLSGGEKARVALAKTIASKANFLLLDEPTNHLDMHSVDLLIESLQKYEGTYLLVSHDRYFVNKTANKIWEIDDYKIREFVGTYDEWEVWKKDRQQAETESKKYPVENKVTQQPVKSNGGNSVNKESQRELQKLQKNFEKLEAEIERLKKEKEGLEKDLGNPDFYLQKEKFLKTEKLYAENAGQLEKTSAEYEILFEKILMLEEK